MTNIKIAKKTKLLLIINGVIGAWLGITAITQFAIFLNGGTIFEPDSTVATLELVLACLFTIWFVAVFPILVLKGLKTIIP